MKYYTYFIPLKLVMYVCMYVCMYVYIANFWVVFPTVFPELAFVHGIEVTHIGRVEFA